jgi:hypothetical protein
MPIFLPGAVSKDEFREIALEGNWKVTSTIISVFERFLYYI